MGRRPTQDFVLGYRSAALQAAGERGCLRARGFSRAAVGAYPTRRGRRPFKAPQLPPKQYYNAHETLECSSIPGDHKPGNLCQHLLRV